MKITKYGHCCLLIETNDKRILTDPGGWSDIPDDLSNLDAIVITHEHGDHLHIDSLKQLLENNPQAKVITNKSVGKIIAEEEIAFTLVADGDSHELGEVKIEGVGDTHAHIYADIPTVENTGYIFNDRFYYPGDAFYNPKRESIEILALPVCGPWMHISEAVDFAKAIKPKHAFPVHDGMLKEFGPFHYVPTVTLEPEGIEFKPLMTGESRDFS